MASSSALTVTANGTYLATVILDAKRVNLLVDMQTSGLWVKCSALEDPACANGITDESPGYTTERFNRFSTSVKRETRRFKKVQIAGQTFNEFDAFVVYDSLREVDPSIHGVLGLKRPSTDYGADASLYVYDLVTTVALQLGESSRDSVLSFNTVGQSLLTSKGLKTAVSAPNEMECLEMEQKNGLRSCWYPWATVHYDPALPFLGLMTEAINEFEVDYMSTCSRMGSAEQVTGYTCAANVKLPRILMQLGSWQFSLEPNEYSTVVDGASQVHVLVGKYDPYLYKGSVLGAPFLRKDPFVYNATGDNTLYCIEKKTCKKHKSSFPKFKQGSVPSKDTDSTDERSDTSSDTLTTELEHRVLKMYLSIGFSIDGLEIFIIVGCIGKRRKAKKEAADAQAQAAKTTAADEYVEINGDEGTTAAVGRG